MLRNLRSISLGCLLFLLGMEVQAQEVNAPVQETVCQDTVGATRRYSAMIELPKAYLSGVCILKKNENGVVVGCLFNEFGISALEFTYQPGDKKVKLLNVIQMMNKWYIKRIISRDLAKVYQRLLSGESTYRNEKYHITYRFTPMPETVKPEGCEDVHHDLETISYNSNATQE